MNDQLCKGKIEWGGPDNSNSLRTKDLVQRGFDFRFLWPIARIHYIILCVSRGTANKKIAKIVPLPANVHQSESVLIFAGYLKLKGKVNRARKGG
jgi:hypothetical protein